MLFPAWGGALERQQFCSGSEVVFCFPSQPADISPEAPAAAGLGFWLYHTSPRSLLKENWELAFPSLSVLPLQTVPVG